MSKNSKNSRVHAQRQSFKRAESAPGLKNPTSTGNRGPKQTKKVNTKVNTWFARKDGKTSAPAPRERGKRGDETTEE